MDNMRIKMKNIQVILILLALVFYSNVVVKADNGIDTLRKRYQEAKVEYLKFEEKHGGWVQTENVRMHYLSWGNSTDVPLIWLHGSLTHSYELAGIAGDLTAAGYYLIAVDYYGHGKTAMPAHDVSLYHIADDVRTLMDSLQIEKAVIGGFSRGGYIAAGFYDSYPNRTLGLILEDGGSVAFNSYHHRMDLKRLSEKASLMNLPVELDSLYNGQYDSEFDAYKCLYDVDRGGFELLSLINQKGDKWITYKEATKSFHMNDSAQFMELVLRPSHVPLYGASISMIQPKIIFRNLRVPLLILDPVSVGDPMPFEMENMALEEMHPTLITRKEYGNTEHNIHYEHPKQFASDLIDFLKLIEVTAN